MLFVLLGSCHGNLPVPLHLEMLYASQGYAHSCHQDMSTIKRKNHSNISMSAQHLKDVKVCQLVLILPDTGCIERPDGLSAHETRDI